MYFGSGYFGHEPVYYSSPSTSYFGEYGKPAKGNNEAAIEEPIVKASDIGFSVPEGSRFGSLVKTTTDAIRRGAGWIELSTSMGGGQESVGAEAYGKEAREALRDIARINQVRYTSVHTPANIGNMSGYNPQERGFNDEHRKIEIEEVKKAIDLASDVGAQAIVVHTGEFQRDITTAQWNKKRPDGTWEFMNYSEEPGRAVLYMVDDRTGKLITEVRKSQVVHEPKFEMKMDDNDGRMKYINKDGNYLDETKPDDLFQRVPIWNEGETKFETNRLTWEDFEKRAEDWNKHNANKEPWRNERPYTPEEMFFRSQMETRIMQARGSSLFHGRMYQNEFEEYNKLREAYDIFKKIEDSTPIEEQWKMYRQNRAIHHFEGGDFVPNENLLPSEIIKRGLDQAERSLKFIRESSAAADANADETYETLLHVVPVADYAKDQTSRSYAEAGIYAMERTAKSPYANEPITIAPENIFPEMGYGSHPEELIELVQDARKMMTKMLTEKFIEDPGRRRDRHGNIIEVPNPSYTGMTKEEAEKKAEEHIKATIDTQHLGMWWKSFTPLPGETKEQRKERFDNWYMEEVEKMRKANIIGHLHVVDGIGAGHHHLPVGQGDLPVKEAVEYLKKKGYKGTMIAEGYGEDSLFGAGRQMTETWRAFGSPIFRGEWGGAGGAPQRWTDVQHGYFRQMQSPYFIFGAYSPSNDWQLWSQVPLE